MLITWDKKTENRYWFVKLGDMSYRSFLFSSPNIKITIYGISVFHILNLLEKMNLKRPESFVLDILSKVESFCSTYFFWKPFHFAEKFDMRRGGSRVSAYLPGTGGTMIKKVVLPGRGLSIALRLGWSLRLPQMWATRVRNFLVWGTAFALSPVFLNENKPLIRWKQNIA